MTAATTTKVPLSPPALIFFALAVAGTILTIPHVIIASMDDWPPQLMTLHAVATFGLWAAGFHYRAHPLIAAERQPSLEPEPLDDVFAGLAALDQVELDNLERKLREIDGW